MTGENSFVRLSGDGGKTVTDRASHWRVLWCPAGAGHALFLQSTLLGGEVRVFGDNAAVVRWLQKTIETYLYPAFADETLAITKAEFSRGGDVRATTVEDVTAGGQRIRLSWSDTIAPFVLAMPPGSGNRPIGVFSTFFPARRASIEIDGKAAAGKPWAEMRGDRPASSACLAWSETWVKPRE